MINISELKKRAPKDISLSSMGYILIVLSFKIDTVKTRDYNYFESVIEELYLLFDSFLDYDNEFNEFLKYFSEELEEGPYFANDINFDRKINRLMNIMFDTKVPEKIDKKMNKTIKEVKERYLLSLLE